MSIPDQRVTLKITRPRHPVLVLGLALFLLACLAAELVARTDFVQLRIPYQAYGMNHTQLELQLNILERYVQENGAPNCFVFGSSQAFREVNPATFARIFSHLSGEPLSCYNFGVTGSQIWSTSLLGEVLIKQYQPRLVILATSFLDYTEGRENQIDERFKQNDWLEYQTGKFTLGGWLTEYSHAWRALTLFSYSAPYGLRFGEVQREARKWDGQIAKTGFALSDKAIDPNQPVEEGFVKNLKTEFGNFGISERNLAALDEIVNFSRQEGAQVLIVEMVYHPELLELKNPRGNPRNDRELTLAFIEKVNARIADIARNNGVTFLKFDSSLSLPETGWFDLYHLNRNGARTFSIWLARQAARIIDLPPINPATGEGD